MRSQISISMFPQQTGTQNTPYFYFKIFIYKTKIESLSQNLACLFTRENLYKI